MNPKNEAPSFSGEDKMKTKILIFLTMLIEELKTGVDYSVCGLSQSLVREGWFADALYHASVTLSPGSDEFTITIGDSETKSSVKLDDTEKFIFRITPANNPHKDYYNTAGNYNYKPEKNYGGCAFDSYDGGSIFPTIKQLIVDLIVLAKKGQ